MLKICRNNVRLFSSREKTLEYLYGSSVVLAALKERKRSIQKLFYKWDLNESPNITKAKALAADREIPTKPTEGNFIDKHSGGRPNQGVLLCATKLEIPRIEGLGPIDEEKLDHYQLIGGDLKEYGPRPFPFWIALDSIVDPQNLGAIMRTAYFFGIDGIILTERDSAPLSPTVSKASAGALEAIDIYSTNNLSKFLSVCGQNGWYVYGTDLNGDSVIELDAADEPALFHSPTILVLGNEGSGIRQSISKKCNQHLILVGKENDNVDSLNVSVACGILIHKILDS
ncbi:hypothetical protein HDV01_007763 [Terramyces sp. JEL0728]|nr:hypothetical protein HDV01_007763 [Terramyces sp. JEL0728]